MKNYAAFKKLFLTKTNGVLIGTIKASQKREAALTQSGNASGAAVEIARIQAAADVLDSRGYYSGGNTAQKPAETASSTFAMGFDLKGKAIALAALAGLWFFVS